VGWHEFLMKHGIGSPGSMARSIARIYRRLKKSNPGMPEKRILATLLLTRAQAARLTGAASAYAMCDNPEFVYATVQDNPDLLSMVLYFVFLEHTELTGPYAPPDAHEVLLKVVTVILDKEAPMWREHNRGLYAP
jgi:hypothetical protein